MTARVCLRLLTVVLALVVVAAACSGDDTRTDDTGTDGTDGTGEGSTADAGGTDTGDPAEGSDGAACATARTDGQDFTLVSVDGDVTVRGTAPQRYGPAALDDVCEVAIVELLPTTGSGGELASLGLVIDMGPVPDASITELANEAAGLLVGTDDEILVDDRTTVSGRDARRLEVALAQTDTTQAARGLLVFIDAGEQVATLTAIALEPDFELAADDIAAVLASLEVTVS